MLTIALAFFLVGIILIVINPLFGLVPGLFLIVVAIVLAVLGVLAKGVGAAFGIGSQKRCPECMSMIPSNAVVCRHCGYRYPE
ncbi:MAG TPA: zinc ribbon domain-containing protein [Candidatus Limnocylindria bacterium]|nr:zinc ribbon domain-containing protein [Candidatus Limnocylindria bacterium]